MRKLQAMFLTLALGAAGCMPTMATGPGSTPETGTPRGEGFCEGKAQEAPGRVVKCEDFRGVQEGTLPSG